MRRLLIAAALPALLLAAAAGGALAQAGAGDAQGGATLVELSERVERAVPHDTLRAELRVEAGGEDAAKLQSDVNGKMAAAIARAKQVPGVSLETSGYSVYQDRTSHAIKWQASQGLRLTSHDFGLLLGLVGALQGNGLVLSDLAPDISGAAILKVQDELTKEALDRVRQRAEGIATALGGKIDRYHELKVGNATTAQPMMRRMAATAAMSSAPPAVEAGDATVSLTVDATIALTAVPR